MLDLTFYKNKKILITGHTGFKGSWMCQLLVMAGAQVTGYALPSPTDPSLFDMCHIAERMNSVTGDKRNLVAVMRGQLATLYLLTLSRE